METVLDLGATSEPGHAGSRLEQLTQARQTDQCVFTNLNIDLLHQIGSRATFIPMRDCHLTPQVAAVPTTSFMSYNNYGPPSGPPPGGYQQSRGYGPPPGAPPGQQQGNFNYGHQTMNAPTGAMPPTQTQEFHGMKYQYSNNSGRRKALLIGINYFNTKSELRGCINDIRAMQAFLERFGYKSEDMVILTDDQRNPMSIPTKANMLRAMQWLVSDARPNDSLFFHYSGHGGTAKDLDGDEDDGYDETIYPVDYERAGHIVDDQLHDIMVRPLPAGCRLTAFFDSCHSGTALDLPFVYSTKGVLKEPSAIKDVGMDVLTSLGSYARNDAIGALMGLGKAAKRAMSGNSATQKTRQTKFSPADVISFSGCKDNQTSADANQGGTSAGAMSYSFLTVMGQDPNQTYISLLNNVRSVMMGKFSQKPQLSCSHPLDMNLRFTI